MNIKFLGREVIALAAHINSSELMQSPEAHALEFVQKRAQAATEAGLVPLTQEHLEKVAGVLGRAAAALLEAQGDLKELVREYAESKETNQ